MFTIQSPPGDYLPNTTVELPSLEAYRKAGVFGLPVVEGGIAQDVLAAEIDGPGSSPGPRRELR
jgi:hypothetical protein